MLIAVYLKRQPESAYDDAVRITRRPRVGEVLVLDGVRWPIVAVEHHPDDDRMHVVIDDEVRS